MKMTRSRTRVTPRGKRSNPPASARGQALGQEIKRAREDRGWRLRDLAKACGRGMSAPKLCRLETGQERIRLEELERIAEALDMPLAGFLGLAAAPKKKPAKKPTTRKPAKKGPAKVPKPTRKPTRKKAAIRVDAPEPVDADLPEVPPQPDLDHREPLPPLPDVPPLVEDTSEDAPLQIVPEHSEEVPTQQPQPQDVPPLVDLDADPPRSASAAVA